MIRPMKRVASALVPVIAVNRRAPVPLHRQIYDAYRAGIISGQLRAGQRIPSTRVLASEIQVSRFPVLNAYAQLLAEGYFESRVGAGTVVSSSLPDHLPPTTPADPDRPLLRSGPRTIAKHISALPRPLSPPWIQVWGAFRVGQVAFGQFPLHVWSNLVARNCRKMSPRSLHYGDQMGSMPLREAIANYLKTARSLRCEPEQVMIVAGSQQALEISARVLLDAGSRVWVEEPCYRLAREVLALTRSVPVPVPVDEEGLDVAQGIKLCRKVRAAFVTPSHQFPLGVTMSAARRLQLIEWAQSSGAWILEDDYDSEFRYESMPIASLQGLDSHSRVIYIGTFSKVLFPALRLGYVVIPADLVDRFRVVRQLLDLGPAGLYQDVLADFIREGHFARHIRRMRVHYGKLRSVLVDHLAREVGSIIEVLGAAAGMHVSVALKQKRRDVDLGERAARQNLCLWPLSPSYITQRVRQGFILGFGGATQAEIPKAVRKMRDLLAA